MTTPRLFVEAPLAQGAEVVLAETQAHYLSGVLRLRPPATLLVFNGRDGEWRAQLAALGKKGLRLLVEEQVRMQTDGPDIELLFAPVKRAGTDLMVEKATELGVRAITPVLTQRTQAETVRLDRLQAIAREAAEQCERLDAPEVRAAIGLDRLLGTWSPSRRLFFADERSTAPPMLEALSAAAPGPAALLVGPEGGFDPREAASLRSLAFVTAVSLGPRILRAETAVIAGLTLLQAAWGDWRRGAPLA